VGLTTTSHKNKPVMETTTTINIVVVVLCHTGDEVSNMCVCVCVCACARACMFVCLAKCRPT